MNYFFPESGFVSDIILIKWVKVFKNGPSKIYGRQTLKNFTWSILEYLDPNDLYNFMIHEQNVKVGVFKVLRILQF